MIRSQLFPLELEDNKELLQQLIGFFSTFNEFAQFGASEVILLLSRLITAELIDSSFETRKQALIA